MGKRTVDAKTAAEVSRMIKPGRHRVGGVAGLALLVGKEGQRRSWVLRVMSGARRRDIGLGSFPAVSLAGAREAARQAHAKLTLGVDPLQERRAARSAIISQQVASKTFDECVAGLLESKEDGWKSDKHRQQWENTLNTYASPVLGKMDVRDIEVAHILKVLEPIWKTKTETASRVRGRIESVLAWAAVRGHRSSENPARWKGHLDHMLVSAKKLAKVTHHKAVAVDDAPAFAAKLHAMSGDSARALEFAMLTAARSGEVRGARWPEIDMKAKIWRVPKERMKAGVEHEVPLSAAAITLLKAQPNHGDATDLVFPGMKLKPLSDMSLSAVMKRMGVDAVPHGLRSTFRQWTAERTNYPREIAEHALAHRLPDKIEAAYQRSTLLVKRRAMMEAWAKFLRGTKAAANDVQPAAMAA